MKSIAIPIIVAIVLIGGALVLTKDGSSQNSNIPADNVSIVDGVQIVEIRAKGGYQPRRSTAKADLPTIIRFNTNGTFDCSSAVRIPSLNMSKVLPQSGVTDLNIGNQKVGLLRGSCGMGMYPFEVEFVQ